MGEFDSFSYLWVSKLKQPRSMGYPVVKLHSHLRVLGTVLYCILYLFFIFASRLAVIEQPFPYLYF